MALDNDDTYDEFDAGRPLWFMKTALLQATNLKVLHIRISTGDHDESDSLKQPISLLPLKELRLSGMKIHDTTLADIMQNLSKTLRCLSIRCCNIHGSWKKVLLRLQQHASKLDYFHITDSARFWLGDSVESEGTVNVRHGLERLFCAREDFFGNESEHE